MMIDFHVMHAIHFFPEEVAKHLPDGITIDMLEEDPELAKSIFFSAENRELHELRQKSKLYYFKFIDLISEGYWAKAALNSESN